MKPARLLIFIIGLCLFLSFTGLTMAFNSSSSSYNLEGEFGIFGGSKSSASYNVSDTGGGFAIGFSNSTDYINCSGFQCVASQVPSITFSLSSNSVSLGTLTTSAVNTQSHTATVTTNFQGYSVTVVQDGNLCRTSQPCSASSPDNDIDALSPTPGTISAGNEAFGLATSQSGEQITQNSGCTSGNNFSAVTTTPQTVANRTSPTSSSGDTFTLCYGATISSFTGAGTYSNHLTYIATGNF